MFGITGGITGTGIGMVRGTGGGAG